MPLKEKILRLIDAQGPISVAHYMQMALTDPEHGYYIGRDPFGAAGDFITAPEVSQIFGELIGLFFVQAWEDRGRPERFHLVELGPGRGTLMADILRAAKIRPAFLEAAEVSLVEASPALRRRQAETIGDMPIAWTRSLAEVADDAPLFLIANEFFDALPIRQFVRSEKGWHERMVTAKDGELVFALAPEAVPAPFIPEQLRRAAPGSLFEICPSGTAIAADIARRMAELGGVALIIDYGHGDSGLGETFQAVKGHFFAGPLAEPGEADLTAHVDFAALSHAAWGEGASVAGPTLQGFFLEALGIRVRAEALKRARPEEASGIDGAVDRLTKPRQMGTLFKVLAISDGQQPLPGVSMLILETDTLSVPGLAHGFFGRNGGVSEGLYASLNCGPGSQDVRAHVEENRRRALAVLGRDLTLVTLYQVHSAEAVTVTEGWEIANNPKADAMVTNRPHIALGILTADCAPVLLADAEAGVIGAAHAGWNGALSGVTDTAIAAMERLGAVRGRIRAAIGPCIGQAAYEVGAEFRARFAAADAANAGFFVPAERAAHWQFDLSAYVAQRLRAAGVMAVEPLGACTYERRRDFFSYRRATHLKEPDYGRQVSMIMLGG